MVARSRFCLSLIVATSIVSAPSFTHAETLGFVLTQWHNAGQFTSDGKLECPNGFNPGHRDNFRAQFNIAKGGVDEELGSANAASHRGPNGESDKYNPELIEDPLPFHEGKGTVSPGFNLDGTKDGRATDKTCAHGKFISPKGEQGIDNQFYRIEACVIGPRPGGVTDGLINNEVISKGINRWLVEIAGVDDQANDDHVEVLFARGLDKVVRDSSGKFIPGLSQRVDEDAARYIFRTTGRIVNHVLITDAIPDLGIGQTRVLERGVLPFVTARLRLNMAGDSAKGVLAGYHDIEKFYRFWTKTTGAHSVVANASPPSIYAALHRLADGYKDPETGKCTAISAAYDMEFVRAFIVHRSAVTEVSENTPVQAGTTAIK